MLLIYQRKVRVHNRLYPANLVLPPGITVLRFIYVSALVNDKPVDAGRNIGSVSLSIGKDDPVMQIPIDRVELSGIICYTDKFMQVNAPVNGNDVVSIIPCDPSFWSDDEEVTLKIYIHAG